MFIPLLAYRHEQHDGKCKRASTCSQDCKQQKLNDIRRKSERRGARRAARYAMLGNFPYPSSHLGMRRWGEVAFDHAVRISVQLLRGMEHQRGR